MKIKIMTKHIFRILSVLCAACVVISCSIRENLVKMQDEIDELRVQMGEINTSIKALQQILNEIWSGGLLTSVEPVIEDGIEIGYTMSFFDGRKITIRQGIDGHTPQIGVALDEFSRWCWTLDGQWLLDGDGLKIPATAENGQDGTDGITPQLKIEDEYWFISTDNGRTWTRLGRAQGKDAVSVFTGIDTSSDAYVEVFLADGGSILIPRYMPLALALDVPDDTIGLSPGETRRFAYEITGRLTEGMVVTAGSDGKYIISVEKTGDATGFISVTCPQESHEGFVYLLVNDGEGHTVVSVINFYERKIKVSGDFSFWVDCNGGSIKIPLQHNFDYTLETDVDWLHPQKTKADMNDGEITIAVDANQTNYVRTGKVHVHPVDHPEFIVETFTIEEASAYYNISQTAITCESAGGDYSIDIQSSRGVSVRSSAGWVNCWLNERGNYRWTLGVSIGRNTGESSRNATITVLNGDGTVQLGTISITQLAYTVDHAKDFIIKIRAAAVYDYTVYLPFRNYLNCVVDWGDGNIESFQGYYNIDGVKHKYQISSPETYSISVSGRVEGIDTNSVPAMDVILAVEQWGNLNTRTVSFSKCSRLESVASDEMGFFSTVTYSYGLFQNCKSLKTIPEGLLANAANLQDMYYAFAGSGISSVPAGLLKGMKSLKIVYAWFQQIPDLKSIPEDLFSNCPNVANITEIRYLFSDSGLESIPKDLFKDCENVTNFEGVFSGTKITTIPADLFANNKKITSVYNTFGGCEQLRSIPVSIFDENRRITNFAYVFSAEVPNLEKQESPYTVIDGNKVHLYQRANYPDDFVTPTSFYGALRAFANKNWGLETIPSSWRW